MESVETYELNSTAALRLCLEQEKPITLSGLMYASMKRGFGRRDHGTNHWRYNEKGLREWLISKKGTSVESGWIPIKDALEAWYVSITTGYRWIKDGFVEARSYGPYPGRIHVHAEQFEAYALSRGFQHQETHHGQN